MKKIMSVILFCVLFSCQNKTQNSHSKLTTIENDTFYKYYNNGMIKEKGKLVNNNYQEGWWIYNDSLGNLIKKEEYWIRNDSVLLNQFIYFNNNRIDEHKSEYFNIKIPDTIYLGRNVVQLNYKSRFKDANQRVLDVAINNQFSDSLVKKEFFGDNNNIDNPKFGIFAHKTGEKIIKGNIIEIATYRTKIGDSDSINLEVLKNKKYFSKEVYVKDTITDVKF
jgi:hypothetical protein